MLFVVMLFLTFMFLFLLVMEFANRPLSFNIVPASSEVDIKAIGLQSCKYAKSGLRRFHRLHKCLFTQDRYFLGHLIQHDTSGRVIRA